MGRYDLPKAVELEHSNPVAYLLFSITGNVAGILLDIYPQTHLLL